MNPSDTFQQAFGALFTVYTGPMGPPQPGANPGIGKLVTKAAAEEAGVDAPFLYTYGSGQAFFTANNAFTQTYQPPVTSGGFANGMVELAAVSHLGPAMASLVRLYQYGTTADRSAALAQVAVLQQLVAKAQLYNTTDNWKNLNPVFDSYAVPLKKMIDAGLMAVSNYLDKINSDNSLLTFEHLRDELLDGSPKPFNHVMIATFALANLADHFQGISWLNEVMPDTAQIPQLAVLISGSSGRASAGLSPETNPSYQRLEAWANSKGYSIKNRMFIIPSGPSFSLQPSPSSAPANLINWPSVETSARNLWWQTQVAIHLSEPMFKNYPSKAETLTPSSVFKEPNPPLSEFITHVKYALGNSTQELASCTSGFMLRQLLKNNNNPTGLWIPGLED